MKPAVFAILWGVLLVFATAGGRARDTGINENGKQELLGLENHWLEVEGDPNALDSILASDFLHVVPTGIIRKSEQIEYMRKHPTTDRSEQKHFENIHVRIYGNVGVVNGAVIASQSGAIQKTLFTDVFAYRGGRWQAINAQELPAARGTQ